jgi:regulator of PEP synthase PpsR (kinase-PPPase family)
VPEVDPPAELETATKPLVVGLFATPERIVQIRQNRMLSLNATKADSAYIDREHVTREVAEARKLCAKHGWPSIDVSRRSIEETAAAVIALLQERRRGAELA